MNTTELIIEDEVVGNGEPVEQMMEQTPIGADPVPETVLPESRAMESSPGGLENGHN
jgi:hypothetical protein